MKKTEETSVNAVSTQVKKEGEKKEVKEAEEEDEEEEEDEDDDEEDDDEEDDDEEDDDEEGYSKHINEMYFFLNRDPSYKIWAEGQWRENAAGKVVGNADTYFHHILSGRRCETAKECFQGWTEQNEEANKKWETLCQHIEELDGLEQIICDEKRVGV